MRLLLSIIFLVSIASFVHGQNLVVNPGSEVNPTIVGWTLVSCHWNNDTQVPAHSGTYHFYAGGADANPCELYQDIDVSSFSASIDANSSTFTFSTWMRSYAMAFGVYNDRGRAIVEYRNASSTVLSTYDTGLRGSLVWTQYSDVRVAPAGTRTIRIRLISDASINSDSDGYFDDVSLTHSTTLPVHLLSFTSAVAGAAIEVKWQTASEESNAFFTVEKSEDGMHWKVIAVQEGTLSSQQLTNYQLLDEEPVHGVQYYKLIQTDVDGKITTFPIIVQVYETAGIDEVQLFPNPTDGVVSVKVLGVGKKKLRVVSATGQEMLSGISFDTQAYFLELGNLPAGYYVIEVHTGYSVQRRKLLKQ
ncbi:MAG: T9SS type A sorting domain-containing protein [Cytophagaceae bacterium]|nr:T9SS type A sorting domain-containing protein [Cytophagaceae bacterium]